MVIVVARQQPNVQAKPSVGREGAEKCGIISVLNPPISAPRKRQIDARPAAAAQVDRHLRQGIVERHRGVAEATDAAPLAQRLDRAPAQG